MSNYYFKKILVQKGIITEKNAINLLKIYQDDELELILHLIKEGIETRDELGKICGDSLSIAYTNLKKITFQPNLVKRLPKNLAKTFKIIPLYEFGNTVTIATSDPKNLFLMDRIEKTLKCQVSALFSFPDEIDEAIEEQYKIEVQIEESSEIDSEISIDSEIFEDKTLTDNSSTKSGERQVFSPSTQKYLIKGSKEIIEDTFNGQTPKKSTSVNLRNIIVEGVCNKIDLSFGFNQLRINDEYTYSHCVNVAALTAVMCKSMDMDINMIKEVTLGALLHDIGKMRVPKVILYKPDKLTSSELEIHRRHPQLGYQIVKMMELSESTANMVLSHHERIDGNGYPAKLVGDAIPVNTQIISIANTYDELVSTTHNSEAMDHHQALNMMLLEGDQAFDFDLIKKFVSIAYKQNYESLKGKFKSSVYGEII